MRNLTLILSLILLSVDYIITYLGIDSSAIIRRCDVIVVVDNKNIRVRMPSSTKGRDLRHVIS
jgi:hypothetical protein